VGRAVNLMISPHPRAKRAKNPRAIEGEEKPEEKLSETPDHASTAKVKIPVAAQPQTDGLNSPFASLEIK
jgi:hypothetical protein